MKLCKNLLSYAAIASFKLRWINSVKLLSTKFPNQRDGVVVRASASQSVDLGFIPKVELYQKTLKMVFTASLLGAQHKQRIVWRTSRQAGLLCP